MIELRNTTEEEKNEGVTSSTVLVGSYLYSAFMAALVHRARHRTRKAGPAEYQGSRVKSGLAGSACGALGNFRRSLAGNLAGGERGR